MYSLLPSPANEFGGQTPFITVPNALSIEQIDEVIRIGNSLMPKKAVINAKSAEEDYSDIRRSKTSWISFNNDTVWLYDQIAYVFRMVNGKHYNFDLTAIGEALQYTVYDGWEKDHYTWHQDFGANNLAPRKLSMVIQLTDPKEYDGGDLQVFTKPEPETVTKEKGLAALFPSWTLHRVTPVTFGTRRSLVIWCCGPTFR